MHRTFDFFTDLETAALFEISAAWRDINSTYFRNAMMQPSFELRDGTSQLGHWQREHRTIALSRDLVFGQRWGVVVEVLKHEVAHQFAHEVLGALDETAHGAAFRTACERMAIDPAASGLPDDREAASERASDGDDRVVQRIARLLSLATSPNQHEAEAATLAARRLMLKHNIDAARTDKKYCFKHLGVPVRRLEESTRVLGRILGDHFFVEVIWVRVYCPSEGRHGTVLEVVGTHANLAIAEFVHAYLTRAADELWRAHQRTMRGRKGGRLRFQAGVMYGFLEKLESEKQRPDEPGLVWVKDGALDTFFRKRHPRIIHFRREGQTRDRTFQEGRSKGRALVLNKAVDGAAANRGLLLKE